MNKEETKEEVVGRMQREILGESSDITEEARTNLRTITLAAIPYMNRGIPLVDIVKAVNKQWDKFLEKADELNYCRSIDYWGARTRALAYAMSRPDFAMPIDAPTVSFPQVYESLPRHVMDFLKSIDKDETILVVSDYGKGIYRYESLFSELGEFLLTETHHMKVRIGGNSYRFAGWLFHDLLRLKMTNCRRFEFFRIASEEETDQSGNRKQNNCEIATVRYMSDYKFDITSDFMRYVDKYDIRGAGAGMNYKTKTVTVYDYGKPMVGAESIVMVPLMMSKDEQHGPLKDGTKVQPISPKLGLRGSMAVLWVRKEQPGFLHDGEFCIFNSSEKGAWAIGDVMMVKGYEDVPPATHALYGDAVSNLAPNQRRLFEDAGLVCHHLIRSYEEVDEERRRYARIRES